MKILVENYNNIEKLDYELSDGKINFLFGICGSGKSSIGCALVNENTTEHVPYDKKNSIPNVKVNDNSVEYDEFRMFDVNYMHNVLIEKKQGEDIYNILLGDNSNIERLKDDYRTLIDTVLPIKNEIYQLKGKIDTLKNNLKIAYKNDGNYKVSCVIHKLINNTSNQKLDYVKSKKYSSLRIKWFQDGKETEEYQNDKCPFCNKKLSEARKLTIDKISIFDAKSFEKINAESSVMADLQIDMPNWTNKREVTIFNTKVKDVCSLLPELDEIIKYLHMADNTDVSFSNLKPLKVSYNMKKYYPNISFSISNFNENYSNIRKQITSIKTETNKLISKNINEINNMLEMLGVKYKFVKTHVDDSTKKASFIIEHSSLQETKDCTQGLSYGERNIIGLVLFLIAHKDKKCLIIDDPASSYDEYRRKVIFDMLYNLKSVDSTVLVLSHDHIFAKYATYHLNKALKTVDNKLSALEHKYKKYTGNVDYIETFKNVKFKNIETEDFKTIEYFVEKRLEELPREITYQVAMNLRLYYEIKKYLKNRKTVYGYLSAILHNKTKEEIVQSLRMINKEEEDILAIINQDLNANYSKLDDNYLDRINIEEFNPFEKVIYAREKCPNTKRGKIIKDELNNIVHMNLAYAICLNPYKFNYFSKFVYDYVTSELNIELD